MSSTEPSLPEKFYEGLEQFNRQEFFEAHETLESVWKERKTRDRVFIQGIIQIAVACHHIKRGNIEGALSLFRRGMAKLDHFKPCYGKVDIEKLATAISSLKSLIADGNKREIAWPRIMLR